MHHVAANLVRKVCAKFHHGGLGATYVVHLRFVGKLVVAFLLVIIELFFARCFRFVTTFTRLTDGRTVYDPEYRVAHNAAR